MAASEQRHRDYSANDNEYDRVRPAKRRRFEDNEKSHEGHQESKRHDRYERHESRGHVRSASPDKMQRDREGNDAAADEHRQRHRRRHRHHHHHQHRSSRPVQPAELPYGARPLSKTDIELFRPLLARYIEVQKNKDMGDMDEREIRGRWKSFAAKWNEGTLAQSWYDPELFEETRQSGFWDVSSKPKEAVRNAEDGSSVEEQNPGDGMARNQKSNNAGSDDDDDEGDDYGPVLPGSSHYRTTDRKGPGIPSLQDLEVRREMDEEDRLDSVSQLRLERKADRAEQKARLEELVPRAEAGTRERKLEKKKEVNEKMKGFRDRSPGAAEVNDGELMGGGDSVDELKRMRASAERKKTEKEIRREEIRRAKDEERKERLKEYREKEDKAMVMLKELAKQRFGSGVAKMDDDEQLDTGLFQEPADYAPPKPPTLAKHVMKSGQEVPIHLVGYNLREGHYLWNGARYISHWFEDNVDAIRGKTVFELGAGGGLPGIVAAILGARKVVCTDYPDEELMVMIRKNAGESESQIPEPRSRFVAEGYEWGCDPAPVLAHLETAEERKAGFDVLILADLLFKHPQHENMVKTIEMTLSRRRESKALVFFTSYRPWLQHADLAFFDRARDHGFVVDKIFEQRLEKPMFENDPGDLEVQKLCTGWEIKWPEDKCTA